MKPDNSSLDQKPQDQLKKLHKQSAENMQSHKTYRNEP
jgi:hypothetical protein